jgi:hypothetical protein
MAQEVEKDHGDSFCSCVTIFKEENTESENAALAAPNLCSCVHDGAAFLHKICSTIYDMFVSLFPKQRKQVILSSFNHFVGCRAVV